jgi:hypothetical protein
MSIELETRLGEGVFVMLNVVIALVLLAHGIGHSMGLLQIFKIATVNPQWQGDSWILTGVAGGPATQAIGAVLWIAAIAGFTALAGVVVGWLPASWWQPLAIGSAAVSMVGIAFFPIAFPVFSTIGALVVDVVLLTAVLWYHYVPSGIAA